jgi:hypothetical protein
MAIMKASSCIHPLDWRNIPQCIVNTSTCILERLSMLEVLCRTDKSKNENQQTKLFSLIEKNHEETGQQIQHVKSTTDSELDGVKNQ